DDGVINGGLDQRFFKPLSPKTPIPSSTHELEFVARFHVSPSVYKCKVDYLEDQNHTTYSVSAPPLGNKNNNKNLPFASQDEESDVKIKNIRKNEEIYAYEEFPTRTSLVEELSRREAMERSIRRILKMKRSNKIPRILFHGLDDESQGLDDEGHGLGDEDQGLDDESQGLEDGGLGLEDETVPEGQQQAVSFARIAASEPLGLGYEALRRRELAVREDQAPSTFKVGQSSRSVPEQQGAEKVFAFRQPTLDTWVVPEDGMVYTNIPAYVPLAAHVQTSSSLEWSLGSLPVSQLSPVVPSPISSLVATSKATISVDKDQFIEVAAQLELHSSILHDHTQHLDALPPTLVGISIGIICFRCGMSFGVATLKALVHTYDKTSEDARSCRLGNEAVSEDKRLYYAFDTTYGPDLIQRITNESALAVEINFTWSLGFGFVESGRPPIPLSSASVKAQNSLIMFEFSSCLFADSAMNLVSDSSKVCLRSGYEEVLLLRCVYFLVDFLNSLPRLLSWACIAASPSEVSVFLAFKDVPLCHF
nr:hypothetical protein [Tanacetum cinerariifolium]